MPLHARGARLRPQPPRAKSICGIFPRVFTPRRTSSQILVMQLPPACSNSKFLGTGEEHLYFRSLSRTSFWGTQRVIALYPFSVSSSGSSCPICACVEPLIHPLLPQKQWAFDTWGLSQITYVYKCIAHNRQQNSGSTESWQRSWISLTGWK